MPRLPTFTAKLDGGVISGGRRATVEDTGVVDLGGAARSVSKAAEGFLAAKEEDESRQVLVKQAEIRAKYAKRLDEAATSGEDVQKIREELDNDLSGVTDNLQTKKGADTAALHAANTGAIFDNQVNNILVTRATLTARVDGAKFLNNTGAIVSSNPAYLPQAEQDVDAFVATLSRVPPEKRAAMAEDLKQNLNTAAAMAQARLDPDGVKELVKGGSFNMTPQQREQVIHQADATIRAKRVDENYKRQQEQYDRQERNETARDGLFKGIMAGQVSARQILDNPDLTATTREHLTMFLEQRGKALAGQEKQSNPEVRKQLWLAVNAPDGTPGKIYTSDKIFEAVKRGDLNTTHADQLNSMVANQKDENNRGFGNRLHGRISTVSAAMRASPEYQAQPELAAAIQLEMVAQAEKKAAGLRKEGKSPDELLNPESKDYLFKPNFIKSVADDVKQQARAALPQAVDLSKTPDAAASIEVGQSFIDPRGVQRTMTPQLKKALEKGVPAAATSDFSAWMAATGGVLKPGQTQDQAIAEWKAGK